MSKRHSRNKIIVLVCLALALLGFNSSALAELVVIVNKANNIASMKQSEIARLFLGKSSEFSDGSKAIPINQPLSSATRQQFDSTVLNRSEAQMKSYWSKMMFSGEGSPPVEMNGDLEVLQRVMSDANVIGYVDSSAVNDAVKIIEIN